MSSLLAILAVMVVVSSPRLASAQSAHDFQSWSALFGTATLQTESPRALLWLDTHARRGDAGTVVIARPGLGAQLTPWLSLWGGYAWVPGFSDADSARVDEHRIWQQAILTHSWREKTINVQSRTRFEQRFHETSQDVGLRFRQFVRADYKRHARASLGLAVWNELFWGLNAPGFAPQGFDQNRLFVGPALHAQRGVRLEAGYLWASLLRQSALRHQHALAINMFVAIAP